MICRCCFGCTIGNSIARFVSSRFWFWAVNEKERERERIHAKTLFPLFTFHDLMMMMIVHWSGSSSTHLPGKWVGGGGTTENHQTQSDWMPTFYFFFVSFHYLIWMSAVKEGTCSGGCEYSPTVVNLHWDKRTFSHTHTHRWPQCPHSKALLIGAPLSGGNTENRCGNCCGFVCQPDSKKKKREKTLFATLWVLAVPFSYHPPAGQMLPTINLLFNSPRFEPSSPSFSVEFSKVKSKSWQWKSQFCVFNAKTRFLTI